MEQNRQAIRLTVVIIVVFILFLIVNSIYTAISHSGKTKVTIEVLPTSQIFVNGKKQAEGSNEVLYLKPGEYTFTAKSKGFRDDTQKVTITKDPANVALTPEAASDEAFELLKNDPELQAKREQLGGMRASNTAQALTQQTPLIANLPVTDLYGPYKIDYGPSSDRSNGVFIEISDSSPEGRDKALKWIRQQGQDPTDLEIRYIDFNNPLKPAPESGGGD